MLMEKRHIKHLTLLRKSISLIFINYVSSTVYCYVLSKNNIIIITKTKQYDRNKHQRSEFTYTLKE